MSKFLKLEFVKENFDLIKVNKVKYHDCNEGIYSSYLF